MPSITSTQPLPGSIGNQSLSQRTSSATSLKSIAPKDSVHFGANQTDGPSTTPVEPEGSGNFLHDTPVVKNIYAGLKGLVQGTFEGPWNKHFQRAAGWFGALLPFAIWIPGPHYVLLPGYVLVKRAIEGLRRMITGFREPDKILKPQPATESTV